MGWTTTRRNKNEDGLDILDREVFSHEVDIVDYETVGTTFYCAYADGDDVRALVMLQEFSGDEVSYKIMSETEGPVEAKASRGFIRTLSPTEDTYATDWRNRCLAAG
jgi:hypothetical protein